MPSDKEITFTISLSKGLANRKRLPLQHVISVLKEIQDAARDAGKRIQKERGIEQPTGDFGIELLAGPTGLAFQEGSVIAEAAITRDVANGIDALRSVMETMSLLERKRPAAIRHGGETIVRRLATIAEIQKTDATELEITLNAPGKKKPEVSRFGAAGIATTEKISAAESMVSGITLYGRLRELRDRSKKESGGRSFWGELLTDNREIWRVQFSSKDEKHVIPLFRKRVAITGDATYYRANYPKIKVNTIDRDTERDYDAAFQRLYGLDKDVYGDEDFGNLMAEIRGDA
ncbi:MAG TPA: hypothetical protein VKW78_17005 [Terriglobales bacterium]|nr:hypothetical protein [Terriglobales bacterium]